MANDADTMSQSPLQVNARGERAERLPITSAAARWVLMLASLSGVMVHNGCPLRGRCQPDEINEYNEAALIPPTGPIKDEINAECDKVDWRYVSNHVDSTATLTVRVGDPFEGHDMSGTLSLYDRDAQLLQQAEIRQNETRYEFKLQVVARAQYFLKVEASKGGAPYTAEVIYERIDPCAMCPPCTQCVDNQCVKIPCCGKCPVNQCDAATDVCRKEPCGGPCPEGQECDVASDKCMDAARCRGNSDCTETQKCNRRTGKCYTPRAVTVAVVTQPGEKPECEADKDCSDGKVCAGGKCVPKPTEATVEPGKVKGKITTSLDSPEGIVLRIAVPPGHGIRAGDRGVVHGFSKGGFRVTKTGGGRVEAILPGLKKTELGALKSVTITLSE